MRAVSYTHLDGYKRQACGRLVAGPLLLTRSHVDQLRFTARTVILTCSGATTLHEGCLLYTSRWV
ncbi:hypothetical protein [Erwinia amylovora]